MSSRHVLLIITGIMLTFGCSALTFSTWTNFQPVVSEAMGMVTSTGAIDTAPFALYITVLYLTMTVGVPDGGQAYSEDGHSHHTERVCRVGGIAFILMSIYTEIWQFYISGVLLAGRNLHPVARYPYAHEPLVQEERPVSSSVSAWL